MNPSPPSLPIRPSQPRLTIVIVNHESWDDVSALLNSLLDSPSVRFGQSEIVVVDNASRSPIPSSILRLSRAHLTLVKRSENGGFAAGVNAGWEAARGEWLLVLNPDIVASSQLPDLVLERVKAFDRPSSRGRIGIVGFALMNGDGSAQPSVGAFPSLARCVREQFIPRSRRKYQPVCQVKPGPVAWVTGACILLSTRMMKELGGMDQDFFLYHEEVALCRTARERGWEVEFDPSIRVVHAHPLQDRPVSPKMQVIIRHSKLLYFHKHLPLWQFNVLAWFVSAESAIRSAWSWAWGKHEHFRAWRLVGRIVIALRRHPETAFRGTQIRVLAEAIVRDPQPTQQSHSSAGPMRPKRSTRVASSRTVAIPPREDS